MHGTCRLCGNHTKLEKSHFRPKFIGKWLKRTSITGYRQEAFGHPRISRRVQDLPKDYWLCGNCERRFSKWEVKFANRIFYPFVDKGESTATYGEWLSRFCASLSWRTLTYIRSINVPKDESDEHLMDLAEQRWTDYLLGKEDCPGEYEQHLIPLDVLSSSTVGLPSSFHRYVFRVSGSAVVGTTDWLLAYTKLPKFIVFGLIDSPTTMREEMKPSLIAQSDKISPRNYVFPTDFHEYLIGELKDFLLAQHNIPQAEFDKHIMKDPEKAYSSNQFQAFLHDLDQFGEEALRG